jgi:hypothetical protein
MMHPGSHILFKAPGVFLMADHWETREASAKLSSSDRCYVHGVAGKIILDVPKEAHISVFAEASERAPSSALVMMVTVSLAGTLFSRTRPLLG